ncbi:phosphatidate cytidylyltransferase [Effusibacillus pohliae]|uniref:phosphatidate cytidylyltransferase n=1 Tax=Effusibacillus pohliae TaxID=232270 RepID=UPI00037C16A1|nr:phosphatidate cytidylyltransferase [Effusibacillus pohliae]
MLYERVLTGIVGGAVFLAAVVAGGAWFAGLIVILGLIGFAELLRMKGHRYFEIPALAGFVLTAAWLFCGTGWLQAWPGVLLWTVFGFLLLTVILKNRYTFGDVSFLFVGTLYVGLSFHYVLQVRDLPDGLLLFMFLLLCIWATDTGAYFIGRALKGPKIWPAISPNKTVSGTVAGLAAAALTGAVFFAVAGGGHPLAQWVVTALVISVSGQLGDFVESGIKRSFDVKDSGRILPGHGGVLDRFDSLLFAAPIAYHVLVWFRF